MAQGLKVEPIPEYIMLKGFNKERALTVVTAYHMQAKAKQYDPDEDMIEALEKVHYACVNDQPLKKRYVLRVLPDFRMEMNIPFNKMDMSEPTLKKFYDKAKEEKENEKTRNKDYYNA